MTRIQRLLAFAGAMMLTVSVQANWIEKSDVNSMLVLEGSAEFNPEGVANQGLDKFDGEITDLKPNVYERSQASDRALMQEMQKRLAKENHPKVRQDLEILIQALADGIESAKISRRHLLPYYNLHSQLYMGFNSLLDPRNDSARYSKALERLRKYNGRARGYTPVTELAISRTEEQLDVAGLIGPYRGELEQDIDNAPRFVAGMRAVFEQAGIEGWQEDLELLEKQLAAYQQWLTDVMLKKARVDNQLPPAVYADNLKTYGVRATPDELIKEAQYSYQFIRSEMKALAWRIAEQRNWQDKRLIPVMRALKKEQIPQGKILEVYQQRLAAIEEIIRREDLVTLPERDAVIRLASEAESAAIPASFMSPPPVN